jgi:hypothetical protein
MCSGAGLSLLGPCPLVFNWESFQVFQSVIWWEPGDEQYSLSLSLNMLSHIKNLNSCFILPTTIEYNL